MCEQASGCCQKCDKVVSVTWLRTSAACTPKGEARELERLKDGQSILDDDGDQSLLDRTAIVHTSNLGSSSSHDHNTPFSNFFVRQLHHMGIEANNFGASDGVIREV